MTILLSGELLECGSDKNNQAIVCVAQVEVNYVADEDASGCFMHP
jgi:hypothetical protein